MYHIIYLNDNATLRPANHGINDLEWEHGCRSVLISYKTEFHATGYAESLGFNMLNATDWNSFISSLDDPSNVSTDSYKNSRPTLDRWDSNRPIY